MLLILSRYLIRELSQAILAIVALLLLIIISNMFVHYLSVAAAGTILTSSVWKIIGVMMPRYVAVMLPISVLFGIIVVYGKLFVDNELNAMLSSGMSWWRLLGVTLIPTLVIFLIVLILSLWVMPMMAQHQYALDKSLANKSNLSLIRPGNFTPLNSGKDIFYITKVDPNTEHASDVFVYRESDSGPPQIVLAKHVFQYQDVTHNAYLSFSDGHEYKGVAGHVKWQVAKFKQLDIKLQSPSITGSTDLESKGTFALLSLNTPRAWAEFEWRLSLALAVIVMAIVGVAICRVKPRQGRYANFFPALLIFILYYNLLTLSKSWVQQGLLSPAFSMWPVHLVFIFAALYLILRHNGYKL